MSEMVDLEASNESDTCKFLRRTLCWPVSSITFPDGPSEANSLDYFDSLPTTSITNKYILLVNGRFNQRAAMYSVSAS